MRALSCLFYTLILLCCKNLSAIAQIDSAYLACHYAESYKKDLMKPDRVYQDEMVLHIGKHSSEFFSRWNREFQKVIDSIAAKGGGLQEMIDAKENSKFPMSIQRFVYYKNYPRKGYLLFTDQLAGTFYQYTEPLAIPQWIITKDKKEVAGYDCQKATTTFYGRNWTVWFTSAIPVQDGPWKLCGLPGLILEAEDAEGHYSFKCMEIKKLGSKLPITPPQKKYVICDKEKYFEIITEFVNDYYGFNRRRGIYMERGDGDRNKEPKAQYNNIER